MRRRAIKRWRQSLFIAMGIFFVCTSVVKAGCDITNLTASIDYGASTPTTWSVVITYTMIKPTCHPVSSRDWKRYNAQTGEWMETKYDSGGIYDFGRGTGELLYETQRKFFTKWSTPTYVVITVSPSMDCTGGFFGCGGTSDTTTVYLPPVVAESCAVKIGNPVNITSASKAYHKTDLSIDTPTGKLDFSRSYNSMTGKMGDGGQNQGPLGYGGNFSYNYMLRVTGTSPNRLVGVRTPDAELPLNFQEKGSGNPNLFDQTDQGERCVLTYSSSDNTFTLARAGGNKLHFFRHANETEAVYRPDWLDDHQGRRLHFTYASYNWGSTFWAVVLSQVYDDFGNGFGFDHEQILRSGVYEYNGRISAVYNLKNPAEKTIFSYNSTTNNLVQVTYPDASTIMYYYENPDHEHGLTRVVDESGKTTYYGYDTYNRSTSQHKEGNVNQRAFAYDWKNPSTDIWKTTVTDSLNHQTEYHITESGNNRTISVAGPTCGGGCGSTKNYKYDKTNGNLLETEDGNGIKIQYTNYDAWGNAATVTEAVGTSEQRVTTSSYNASLNLLLTRTVPSILGGGNKQTIYDYDDDGNGTPNENPTPFLHRLIKKGYTRDLSGAIVLKEYITAYTYNSAGQIAGINGPRTDVTDVTAYTYYPDESGQGNNRAMLYQVTNPESQTITYGNYDAYGRVGSITDPNGLITHYTYDFKGRVTAVTLVAAGPTGEDLVTSNFYQANGNLDYIKLPEGGVIDYGYDTAERLTSITRRIGPNSSSAAIDSIKYTYDTEGNKTSETLHEGEITGPSKKSASFAYDDYNRLWKMIHANSTYQEYGYDGANNRASVTDEKFKETTSIFDALNRLKTLTQPGSIVTGYTYDPQDNLNRVTDANGKITTYEYDDFGRMLKNTSPDAGINEYRYDEAGNLIKKTDALGIVTNYTYDALNRLFDLDLPGTSLDVTYTYDSGTNGLGRLTGIADMSGSTTYHYDKRGNLNQEQKTMEGYVFTTQYKYDQNGNLKKITYPNGRQVTYTLNQANQITQVDGTKDSTNTTYAQSATYAPFGPLKTYTAGNGLPIINQYDSDYQLASLQAEAVINRNYQYDDIGNITQINNMGALPVSSAETMTYSYQNNNNQLTQAINATNTTYGYNAAGNLITEQKNGVTRTFDYNSNQRLQRVSEGATILGEYTYDALGRRTKKVAGETTTLYLYDQTGLLIAEYDGTGTWQKDYLYLNGQPLTMIVAATPETVYYYHNDHLGTPQLMTDSAGAVVWSAQYEPFGEATINVEQITNNLRFPGQYFDVETGLCYNWNRDYNQQLGRYIESDPIGLDGGINLYTYVANQPTVYIDPTGLWVDWIHLDMTRTAAREAGCSKAAQDLAIATANVDYLPGSNEPRNAFWHAMVNGYSNAAGRAEDIRNYYDRVNRYTKSCKPEELGLALHAVQDSYAPAHRGFQPWQSRRRDYLPHFSDTGGGGAGRMNASFRTRQIIETAKENCPCLCK